MIHLENLCVEFDSGFCLSQINWEILPKQQWAIIGANGAGKSALAATLCGYGQVISGTVSGIPSKVGLVSFEAQAELIEHERKKDDADILDVIAEGTSVKEVLYAAIHAEAGQVELEQLIEIFQLNYLLDRAFRKLSTGESRKVMLLKALAIQPELLILDEPFDGLDTKTLVLLQEYLASISHKTQMIFVLNRLDEIPEFITHIAYIEQGKLKHTVEKSDIHAYQSLLQILCLRDVHLEIPKALSSFTLPPLDKNNPLVELKNIQIKYTDTTIIQDLNWRIEPQQHWQLIGPNGSGKTGLLTLITGDHPQCYNNDIFVFGFQRGSGESIWQIKQYIGYVSTALQWEYRVTISVRNVIISGFYDSIGLYNRCSDDEKNIAQQWLQLLSMQDRADMPFNKLSYGDQRLLLIARAMVKHPPLLILDEPCLGLDDFNRQLVLALIEKICASTQTTVIYVNHHTQDKIKGIDHQLILQKQNNL